MVQEHPKMVTLTDAAAERVNTIIAKSGKPIAGLRISVENSGCAGLGYKMEYAATVDPGDEVVKDKGVTLFIDSKAVLFLLGTVIDYRIEKLSAGFVFDNPNQTSACGCGESVEIAPASQQALGAFSAGD